MKAVGSTILAIAAFAFLASSVHAATAAPRRSREACMELARAYLALRLQAGETDTEELAAEGLAYLWKLDFLKDREFS